MKQYISHKISPHRFLILLSLGITLIIQSCSKESDSIAPGTPKSTSTSKNTKSSKSSSTEEALNNSLPIDAASGGQGEEVNILWPDFNYGGTPATASTARLELSGPANLIIPHVALKSALGPVGAANGFALSIPSYLPAGTYHILVTTDVANTSLVHDSGSGNFTTAEGTLSVSLNTVRLRGLVQGGSYGYYMAPGSTSDQRSLTITWPQPGVTSKIRFGMRSVSTGTYYILAPSKKDTDAFVSSFFGVGNIFNGNIYTAQVKLSSLDIAPGDYILFLDEYADPSSTRSYWTSSNPRFPSTPFNVPF